MNWNRVTIAGRLTKAIETRTTQSGTTVGNLSIATNRKYKDEETVCYVDCVAFGKVADILSQHLGKGDPLFVEGRLQQSTWEDRDGNKRSKLEVVVENFQFVGGRDDGERQPRRSGGGRSQAAAGTNDDYGDVPF